MDSKNLWIAYSDSEDLNDKNHTGKEQTKKDLTSQNTDSDTQNTIEDKILFTEVRINGQEIHQGLGQRTVNNNALSENPITVEDFTIGEEINTERTVNIEFKVWSIAMSDAETWENIQKIQANTQPYTFKLTTSKEELEKNTVDINLDRTLNSIPTFSTLQNSDGIHSKVQFTEHMMEQCILTVIIIRSEQTIRETKSAIRRQEEMAKKLHSNKP